MTNTYELTVALVYGDTGDSVEIDAQRPYEERPKVSLLAEESDSLAIVLVEATAVFERSHPGDYTDAGRSIDFYRGDPTEGVVLTLPTTQAVTITGPDGLAVWHVPLDAASIGDLVLADQRKVFRGDPLRPYLLVDPSWRMAGGVPGGWDNFVDIWTLLLAARGSWDLVMATVRVSKKGLNLLERAANKWERHRSAARYTRQMFEARGADIMDVIGTAQAARTYQIADLMAWTGIDDPALAEDVAGWAAYELDPDSMELSMSGDDAMVDLMNLVINLSDNPDPDSDERRRQIMIALARSLKDMGLAEDI